MTRTRFKHLLTRARKHSPAGQRAPKINPHRKQVCYTRPGGVTGLLLVWVATGVVVLALNINIINCA